ncbi:cytochrome c oxidase subunit 3 (plasmid) [Photobacterium sp. DA100]|uniref:cytochrome c oxidase subunit 3 n=1 Tax=Photobacterium sp. DA100 TaxID=3027472 RepID=UPI002478DE45|nr:cytochrome c oxidase subunit 3 [Photobacterium sp. DA100]WEM44517.1 cytochrome c oxidase subunit 3 [Photobacterium sp. DA100]
MNKNMPTLTQDPDARYLAQRQAPASTAVWFLLAVITMFFFLFAVAYRIRMTLPDWQALNEPWQLAVSTVMLVMSCVAMHLCYRKAALLPSLRANHALLVWTVIFTLGFVFSQLWAWQALLSANLGIGSTPAASFFYLLTGLHGLHVLGGLVALSWVVLHAGSGHRNQLYPALRLCTRYWHFLLFVWLFLLGLLRLT